MVKIPDLTILGFCARTETNRTKQKIELYISLDGIPVRLKFWSTYKEFADILNDGYHIKADNDVFKIENGVVNYKNKCDYSINDVEM